MAGLLQVAQVGTPVHEPGVDAAASGPVIAPQRLPWLRKAAGRLMFRLGHRQRKRRHGTFVLELVQGVPMVCMPGVLNPKLMRAGDFFAEYLDALEMPAHWSVLDLGTGSGICAVFAARRARRVVAVDITAASVRCATANAWLNGVADRIHVRHGDLFAPVGDERFDLVIFNPPWVRGVPADDDFDRAWRSADLAPRFAAGLAAHLKPGGHALIQLSTYGDAQWYADELRSHGLRLSAVARREYYNERLVIFRVEPGPPADAGASS